MCVSTPITYDRQGGSGLPDEDFTHIRGSGESGRSSPWTAAAALTAAERYLQERMRDPEYAAAYVAALGDLRREEELELRSIPLSPGRVCYLRLPPRLTLDEIERLQRLLGALSQSDRPDDARQGG